MQRDSVTSNADKTLTVRVSLAFRKRGGRRLVLAPEGSAAGARRARPDDSMIKAMARAFRWKRLLESGKYDSVLELAEAEGVNQSYLCRILRLTLLEPNLVQAILDGTQSTALTLERLLAPLPMNWDDQLRDLWL